jgi:hypothetical protein
MKIRPKSNIPKNIGGSAHYQLNAAASTSSKFNYSQSDMDWSDDNLGLPNEDNDLSHYDQPSHHDLFAEIESSKKADMESEKTEKILEAEKDTILANESQILYSIETSKFDPRIYANFQLGSNSSTLDISPGQWV